MMNKIKIAAISAIAICIAIVSCTKDNTVTKIRNINSAADSLGKILAGSSGSSKTWKLTSASGTVNGGAPQTISLSGCVTDNIIQFSNNSAQSFSQTEGPVNKAIKCNSTDSTLVEMGNWAIADDGKSLVVEGEWFDDLSAESEFQYVFTALGEASKLVSVSATTLVVSYSFTYNGDLYVITGTFTSI